MSQQILLKSCQCSLEGQMSPAVVQPWLALRHFRDARDARKHNLAALLFLIFWNISVTFLTCTSQSLVNMKGWCFEILFDSNPRLMLSLGDWWKPWLVVFYWGSSYLLMRTEQANRLSHRVPIKGPTLRVAKKNSQEWAQTKQPLMQRPCFVFETVTFSWWLKEVYGI